MPLFLLDETINETINEMINDETRYDLEKKGHHIVIIDVCVETKLRIINVYRSFRPYGMSPAKLFENQLKILWSVCCVL